MRFASPRTTVQVRRLFALPSYLLFQLSFNIISNNSHLSFTTAMKAKAWTCHGATHVEMVQKLQQANILQSPLVYDLMKATDRGHYCAQNPYQDAPMSIGNGVTISAPHMHAHALEWLVPPPQQQQQQPATKFLDVGCGSGYLTACLARYCRVYGGHVYGIDVQNDLVQLSSTNIQNDDPDLLQHHLHLKVTNGWQGWSQHAPYDRIHVGAAAASLPQALCQQLTKYGIMIVPVGGVDEPQVLIKIQRRRVSETFQMEDYQCTKLLGVRYVPLVHPKP